MEYDIALIPGDGIGPEVMAEAHKALLAIEEVLGIRFNFTEYDLGGKRYLTDKTLLPDHIIRELGQMNSILLGAIGHPEVRPGILEREILLRLRFELDLYINLRPVRLYPGVYTPLKDKGPEDINYVVIRENTEGLYAGGGGIFKKGSKDEIAIQESINTRKGVERCIRFAFEYCTERNEKRRITLCGKSNVLIYESDLWVRVFEIIGREYPDIERDYQHVDALCMWLIKNPERFDVIVTNNMFGDIITDIGAIIQGGLGIAAGGNINPERIGMFEPVGGSAPKYAGKGIINPLAAISSAQMMLSYLGEDEAASVLEYAIKEVAGKRLLSLEAGKMGFSTSQVGDLVVQCIRGDNLKR